jgi:tight adherence protein B
MITVITLIIFTGAFMVAAEYAVWRPERRMRAALDQRLQGLRTQAARPTRALLKQQPISGVSFLHEIYSRLAIVNQLQAVIDQAALPYRASSAITMSVLLLAVAFLAADALELFPFTILAVLFAIFCGCLPIVYLLIKRQRRMRQIEGMLPEAIDLFTRAMRAGHNIHSGLEVLATETYEPLAGEFKKLIEELSLGSTVEQALHSLGDRVPLLDMRFFATGVILQRETGANIVAVMENLSTVIRERLQLRARLRSHTAQQRFSAALLCGLPVFTGIVFYFVRYEYISLLWLTPLGAKFLIYGIFSEIVGILVIRKVGSVRL